MRLKIILLSSFLFLLSATFAGATTYYVSPSGATSWPDCTSVSSPCLADNTTTGKSFLGATAGDIIYFLAGSYNAGASPDTNSNIPAWVPSNNGTSGSPITFKCLSGTCSLTGTGQGPIFGSNGADYIIWDGFKATVAADGMFVAFFRNGSNYNTLQNCELIGRDTGQMDNASIIGLNGITNMLISNNIIHGMTGTGHNNCGIELYNTDYVTVEKNTIYDNFTGIYDKQKGRNNTYRYNFLYNQYGVQFLNQAYASDYSSYGLKIYQNIMASPGRSLSEGVFVSDFDPQWSSDLEFYNNTISAGTSRALIVIADNQKWWNNIISGSSSYTYFTNSGTGTTEGSPTYMDYNIYYTLQTFRVHGTSNYATLASWAASGQLVGGGNPDTHSYYEAPSYTNASGTTPADYKSTATHINNGRGGAYASVIGAYITGNENIGYSAGGISVATTTLSNMSISGGGSIR